MNSEEEEQALRKSEVQKKKEAEDALAQIGKDELEREKEEQISQRAQERAAERKRQKDEKEKSQEKGVDRDVGAVPHVRGASSSGAHGGRAHTPVEELMFEPHDATAILEEENEGEDVIQEEVTFDDLPPHKQKLYSLFGEEEAEYFLHPRIEPERKKVVKVPHAVSKLGGRVTADDLWDTLRDQSQYRLKFADSQIPMELKDAYGAFVRECLTKNKTVAKRSFYSETDVPDNEKLQDSSYKIRMKEAQRRIELMFRAAQTNEDKTGVLLYNNPMPDFNNFEGREGPLRYIPSWAPQDDDEEEEDEMEKRSPSYKKWLPSPSKMELQPLHFDDNMDSYDRVKRDMDMPQENNTRMEINDDDNFDAGDFGEDPRVLGGGSVSSQSLPDVPLMDDEFTYTSIDPRRVDTSGGMGDENNGSGDAGNAAGDHHRARIEKREDKNMQKLVFLTEKDATCEGRFLEVLAAKKVAKDNDVVSGEGVMEAADATPREGNSTSRGKKMRSQTAPATVLSSKPQSHPTPRSAGEGGAGAAQSHTMRATKGNKWEPLTMTALTEHRPQVTLLGNADFAQGREFMWKPILSTATKGQN